MKPQTVKLLGTLIAFGFAGAAGVWPQYAAAFATLAGSLLGALHIPRPGDSKDATQ